MNENTESGDRMRIAIVGPPGAGKTTICTGLFHYFKKLGKHVEQIPELIKLKVYEGVDFAEPGFDVQNTLEQKKFEGIFHHAIETKQITHFITEGPLVNGYLYASFYGKKEEATILRRIACDAIPNYDVIIFVSRGEHSYVNFGRKEDDATSHALERHIDSELNSILEEMSFNGLVLRISSATPLASVLMSLGSTKDQVTALAREFLVISHSAAPDLLSFSYASRVNTTREQAVTCVEMTGEYEVEEPA